MFSVVLGLMLFCNSYSTIPISNDTIPSKSHLVLPEINIKGNAMVAKRRGDTLIFSADRYKKADAIRLEQLLSNVPGFQVDANGRISFNGKPIQRLMLDGDDLTAENYQLISRNLRSLLIDSIQVLENYNQNRLLKGLNDNNGTAINLVLKPTYYGKPTVNFISAYAPKKSGEIQSEMIHFKRKQKQFLLVNTNNIGAYPVQNQLIEHTGQTKQEDLFHSWPLELQNNFIRGLSNRYINQNGDWGLAYVSNIKVSTYTQLRFNLQKAHQYMTNRVEQNQFYSFGDNLTIGIQTADQVKRQYNETAGSIDWNRDKGDKSATKYQLKFYQEHIRVNSTEERELISRNKIVSNSTLESKGLAFSVSQTWKTNSNHIWLLESNVEGSANKYSILAYQDQFINHDSLKYIVTQLVNHSGVHAQTGIGYFRKAKKINFKFWLKSFLSTVYSKQSFNLLQVMLFKNYFSMHIATPITRKINFEVQSMLGAVDYRINTNQKFRMMYHLDHAIVWKRKVTQQLSFNYGILRQGVEIRKLYAGEVYLNGTTLMRAPTDLSFPLAMYSELNFSTIDLYSGLTMGGQLQIKQVRGDYLVSVDLDPFYTKVTELLNGMQSTRSLNLHLEKTIHPIRMKYRIHTNIIQLKRLNEFNSQQFFAKNQVYRFGNFLSTNWRKGYNLQIEYHYIRSKFNGLNERNSLWSNRFECKTSFQFQFNEQINANLSLLRYSGKDITSLDLLDCILNWTIKNKYRLYIQGFNLLNKKSFVEQHLYSNSISTNTQPLFGRRVMFGLDLPF
jgi:hypothetical protein